MASLSNSGLAHPPRSNPGSRFSSRPPFPCITPSTETCVVVVDGFSRPRPPSPRRDILRRCAADEPSVSRLAQAYPMSFAAVQKHVAVMERAGLVTKERRGREQLVRTDAGAVGRARQALDELETTWRGRVERMSDLLAQGTEPEGKNSTMRGTG